VCHIPMDRSDDAWIYAVQCRPHLSCFASRLRILYFQFQVDHYSLSIYYMGV
jgi:hypothetical protein